MSVPIRASWDSKNGKSMPFGVTLITLPGRDRDLLEPGKSLMEMEIWTTVFPV